MKLHAYAVLSGLLYFGGYPAGFGFWPLSCVALVPLLVGLERQRPTPLRALGLGALASIVSQLLGYAFLPATLAQFSGLPWAVCLLAHLALCVAQAGGMALWLAALSWLRARGMSALSLAPPLWALAELFWPTVFEAPFAAALHHEPGLLQTAELGGASLVSLLLVALNASITAIALAERRRDRAARNRGALAFIAVGLIFAGGLPRYLGVRAATAQAPRLRLGLVQANLGPHMKRRDPRGYALRYVELTTLLREPVDLLIWPETALALPVPADVASMEAAHPSLAKVPAPFLTGAVIEDGDRIYNSALLFDAERKRVGRVDKHTLLPFAEQLPFGDRWPSLYALVPGAGHFSPGTGTAVLPLGKARLAMFICYEDMLPGLVRRAVVDGRANIMVSLSNDAWFGDSHAAFTHFAVAKLRAVELRRSLVRATNSGVTAIIAPTGAVSTIAPQREHGTVAASTPMMTVVTPYARWGNAPLLALVFGWVTASAVRLITSRRRSRTARAA